MKLNTGQSQNVQAQVGQERGPGGMERGKSAWEGRFMATSTIENDS